MLRFRINRISPQLYTVQKRNKQKDIHYRKTRLPPKIKKRIPPNEHKNTVGYFHNGKRLSINITKHFDRHVDVINKSAYHPPFLVHDYIYDTADYILEPFNAGKGVVMNRCHVNNAFDFNGIDHFRQLVHKYLHEPSASSVTFLKSKNDIFSTGTNFIEIFENKDSPEGRKKIFKHFRTIYKITHSVHNGESNLCPFIDGLIMGSAASFAVNCRVTSVSPKADLCWPETSYGFHPDAGAVHILNTLPCGIGTWMALTGSRLTGHSIVRAGLANYCFTEDLVQSMQMFLDDHKYAGSKVGIKFLELMAPLHEEPFELLPYLEVMERCFTKNTMPEVMEALEYESKRNDWAKLQLEKLKTKSPLSLVMTLEALRRSVGKSINFVLRQDFRLTQRFIDTKDFHEGVSKLIVNRKKKEKPEWEYKTIYDVPQDLIDQFFSPTGNEDTEFIIDGRDDKENLEHKIREIKETLESLVSGEKKPQKHHLKLRPGDENRLCTDFLSNFAPEVPVDEVLTDDGFAPLGRHHHPEEPYSRADKDIKDCSTIFREHRKLEGVEYIERLRNLFSSYVYAIERPVSETGEWRSSDDVYDGFYNFRNFYNVAKMPYPVEDSVIRGRTYSLKEDKQKEEKKEDPGDPKYNFIPDFDFKDSPINSLRDSIGRKGVKYPDSLEKAKDIDFNVHEAYNEMPTDTMDKNKRYAIPKEKHLQDPDNAIWDSDF